MDRKEPSRGGRRSFGGVLGKPGSAFAAAAAASAALTPNGPRMRMGTRTSMSALHREKLRLHGTPAATGNRGGGGGVASAAAAVAASLALQPPAAKKRSLDLDYEAMEVKSILPRPPSAASAACVLERAEEEEEEEVLYDDGANESLSESLLERFDAMEPVDESCAAAETVADSADPDTADYAFVGAERRIVPVSVAKDAAGRLGLKITGTPGGIYVDGIDRNAVVVSGRLRLGDRLVAVEGRSLENVSYGAALELIRRADKVVNFLVSQIKTA